MDSRKDKGGNHAGGVWTDPLVEELKQLWADGYSYSQIARALGNDISRCAVSGKVARLGLPARVTTMRSTRTYSPRLAHLSPPPPPKDEPPYLGEPGTFTERHTCKFIKGNTATKDWVMCGQPVAMFGTPWCAYHRSICFDRTKTAAANNKGEQRNRDFDFRRAG
jgi:GcrA cell cycle regulator